MKALISEFFMRKRVVRASSRGIKLAASALAITAAVWQAGPASAADTTLNVVVADYGTGPGDSSQKYWQAIVDDFKAANPGISVNLQAINWNDFDTKIQTMVQNRQYPDVIEGNYYASYAEAGLLYPVSEVFSNPDNLMPAFKKLGSFDDVQYGMPFTTSARAFFYNKKLFAAAGIKDPPKTWDELSADAAKIKAQGAIGFGLPLGPEEAQAETLLWFLGNGGGYQDADGKWTISSDKNVETLKFLTKLVGEGVTAPNPGTKNRTDLYQQFAHGQIGMINGMVGLLPIVKNAGVLKDDEVGAAPIVGKDGVLDTTLGVCDFVSAFKGDDSKKDAIKKFLDFAYQDKYQIAFANQYVLLPGTTSAAKQFAVDQPVYAPFVEALSRAVQYPSQPVWAQVRSQIQQTIGTALTSDPKAVLDAIQQTAEKDD